MSPSVIEDLPHAPTPSPSSRFMHRQFCENGQKEDGRGRPRPYSTRVQLPLSVFPERGPGGVVNSLAFNRDSRHSHKSVGA